MRRLCPFLVLISCGAFAQIKPAELSGNPYFRPLTLSGKVTLANGNPPPDPAMIILWCDGKRQPQYYTDRKGKFSFRVGGEQSLMAADSQSQLPSSAVGSTKSDQSHVDMQNCEVEASLAGFSSTKVQLGRRSVFESSDIGTLILTPLGPGEAAFVSTNTLAAPPEAKKAYERADKELLKEKADPGKAMKDLKKAIASYPQYADAWYLLGQAQMMEKDLPAAKESFEKAAAADGRFVRPLLSLARLEMQQQHWKETAEWSGKVLKMVPKLGEAHFYNAVAQVSMGNAEAAEQSARAVTVSPEASRYPKAYFILGNILAQKGEAKGAAAEFRKYVTLEPGSRAAEAVKKQLAEWEAGGLLK